MMPSSELQPTRAKWQIRLDRERAAGDVFSGFDETAWRGVLAGTTVTSVNHDTGLALDWPHYCLYATDLCGGPQGWCYTFQGNQAWKSHDRKVAMVDILARIYPELFSEHVVKEVAQGVRDGLLAYPNLRYSGSGEMTRAHLPALALVAASGVHLWGFTRQLDLVEPLRRIGANSLFSCDASTDPEALKRARELKIGLAYTSSSVEDRPPEGATVVFPLHRGGRVKEVVDAEALCPKVLEDFMFDARADRYCQSQCHRCHGATK